MTLNGLIVASPSGAPLGISVEQFVAAVEGLWAEAVIEHQTPTPVMAVTLGVGDADGFFTASLADDLSSVHADGMPIHNAKIACLVRELVPADGPRLIAFDDDWSGHVELVPGMTPERFFASLVDHSVPGWNEGDPDLW